MPIWTSLLWLDQTMMFLVCAESNKVSDSRHLSELRISGFGSPPTEVVELLSWSQGMTMLGKDSAPSGRASWSVLAMNPVCFIFEVG